MLRGASLVAGTARRLVTISLANEDGAFLGAEDDLLPQLGVSRPTLRQAAKIAESERMLVVRRGTRGGFYAARPNVEDSIRSLNHYLRMRGVTLQEMSAIRGVSEEAATLAAQCRSEEARVRLAAILASAEGALSREAMLRFDTDLIALLANMSGNPLIEVLITMVYSFGWEEEGFRLYEDEAERLQAQQSLVAIGTAVLDGDCDLARFHMRRRLDFITRWIKSPGSTRTLADQDRAEDSIEEGAVSWLG